MSQGWRKFQFAKTPIEKTSLLKIIVEAIFSVFYLVWPSPSIKYFVVVSAFMPIGPRA